MTTLSTTLTVLGAVFMGSALLSRAAQQSPLSVTAAATLVGVALGRGGFKVLSFDPRSGLVSAVASVALVVILFRDGLEVDSEFLRRRWALPLRKLVVAMPLTALIVALAARTLVGLSWAQALLLGALLAPTDPVLSSAVVTDSRVPASVRHSLNLESGLNDGLALPAVLAFAAALDAGTHHFVWWRFVLGDVGLGVVYGVVCALVASAMIGWMIRHPRRRPVAHQRALFGLGVALVTYGVTFLGPHGNGLIAVFVCAIVLGIRQPGLHESFAQGSGELVEIVKLGVFVIFGSLLTAHGLLASGWGAVATVLVLFLVARPVAVAVALAGSPSNRASRAFMAWFGPKGVATMTFSLMILHRHIAGASVIFNLAALAVLVSTVVHGVSETAGVRWIGRRGAEVQPPPAQRQAGAPEVI